MIKSGLILPYKQSRSLPREKYRKNWIFYNYIGDFWGRAKGLLFVKVGSNALNSALDRKAMRMACSGSQYPFLSPEMCKTDNRGPWRRRGGIKTEQGISCIVAIVVTKKKCLKEMLEFEFLLLLKAFVVHKFWWFWFFCFILGFCLVLVLVFLIQGGKLTHI